VLGAKGGGLAALGRALIAPTGDDAGAPCAVALGGKAPPRAAPAQRSQPATPVPGLPNDIGNAIGKLLGR
jgi:hypothetical protein